MLTEDHKCHVNIPYNMEIHPNLHVAKLTRQRFTEQMNNVNKACFKRNRTRQRKGIFFNGIVSHLISTQESKQTSSSWSWLQLAAVKVWQSISGEDTQHLVTSMVSTLQAVIDRKGFLSKYWKQSLCQSLHLLLNLYKHGSKMLLYKTYKSIVECI